MRRKEQVADLGKAVSEETLSVAQCAAAAPLGRVHFAWMALGYLALAVYGSLVPLDFRAVPLDEAMDQIAQIPRFELTMRSRADWAANILLFIPLGYLLMAALCVDRPRWLGIVAAGVVVPCCVLASMGIELTQAFIPPRTVSANDVAAESLGALIGTVLWLIGGQTITEWCRRVWTARRIPGVAGLLLPGYLVFLVVIHVMPMDLTISPVEVYHKWRQGRIHVVPFCTPYDSVFGMVQKNLWNIAYFLPVGVLFAAMPERRRPVRRDLVGVLAWGLAIAATVECLQLFVYTRHFDTTDVFTGTLGVVLGWATVWLARATVAGSPSGGDEWSDGASRRDCNPGLKSPVSPTVWALASAVWLGVLVTAQWQPFDFAWDTSRAADRLYDVRWIPLADYYWQSVYNSFDQFLQKSLTFLALGVLLTLSLPEGLGRLGGVLVMVGVLCVALVLEAGQLFLPSRYPGFTDVLIEVFGGWLGLLLARRIQAIAVGRQRGARGCGNREPVVGPEGRL